MGDKILIMNFNNECIGYVERTKNSFVQNYQGKVEEFQTLPHIMQGIAPEPTQFPAANEVLEYYYIKIQMNAFANVNRHSIDILPHCIIPYLKKAPQGRFSTVHGRVYDLREYPSLKGLIGRLIFYFD